jgi:hypothetical protein
MTSRDGNSARRPSGRRGHWTLELCVGAVRRHREQLSARQLLTKKGYLAWAIGREDAPSPATFDRYGGWKRVAALARSGDPVPHEPTKDEQAEAAVLEYIDASGKISSGELQTLLGISEHTGRPRPQAHEAPRPDWRRQRAQTAAARSFTRARPPKAPRPFKGAPSIRS